MDPIGFRIRTDLSDFFNDERSWSYIFVNLQKQRLIEHVADHIKHVFMINEPVVLFCDKLLLPFSESVNVLKEGDKVRVAKVKNSLNRLDDYVLHQVESEENVCVPVEKKSKKRKKQIVSDTPDLTETTTLTKRSEITNGLSELDDNVIEVNNEDCINSSPSKSSKRKRKQDITDDIPDFSGSSTTVKRSEITNGLSELDDNVIEVNNQDCINSSSSKSSKRKRKQDITDDIPDFSGSSTTVKRLKAKNIYSNGLTNGNEEYSEVKKPSKKNKKNVVYFKNNSSDVEVQQILLNTFHEMKHTSNLSNSTSVKSNNFENNLSQFNENCGVADQTTEIFTESIRVNETDGAKKFPPPSISADEEHKEGEEKEEQPIRHKRRRRHRTRKKKKATVKNILVNNPDLIEVNISDTLQQKNLMDIFLKNKHVRFSDESRQENSLVDDVADNPNNMVTTVAQVHAVNVEDSATCAEQLTTARLCDDTNSSSGSGILSNLQSLGNIIENQEATISETLKSSSSGTNVSKVVTNCTESSEKHNSSVTECEEQISEQRNIENGIDQQKTGTGINNKSLNEVQHKKIYSEADFEKYPVLSHTPKHGDLVLFKVLKITENCTPELSQYIFARVNNFYMTSQEMDITVLEGHKELEPSLHRLSWNANDDENKGGESSSVMNWNEIYEPRLVFSFNSNLPSALESRNKS